MIIQKKKFQLGTLEFFSSSIQEILSQGSVHISNHFLFSNCNFSSCKGGLLDTKMGALRDDICSTCKKNWKKCPGHFGFMKLCLPVFNMGYIKSLLGILQIICKGCSRVLIPKGPKRENFLKYLRKTRTREESIRIKGIMKLIEKCRNQDFCPFCNSKVGIIKKIGICNFIQEFRFSDDRKKFYSFVDSSIPFFNIPGSNVLDPLKIFHILQKVPFDDLEFFDMDQIRTRPENLLLSFIPVPPIIIRPSIPIGEKLSNEDDLTVKLSEIQQINYQLKKGLFGGSSWFNLKEKWNILQIECARYLNSEIFPKELNSKLVKGLYQRLKGKNGRFRGNLSGKRVDFSGRTVISPDPNIEINKIGVPLLIACHLSFPERVTFFNKKRLERCVMRGVTRYPGANYLINTQQNKIILENFSKLPLRLDIREGFIIERHLKDNDVILFNRQPSLHRISIMAHRIKIMPGKTFRMNECICKPYNADFDGDEMNIHIPQTQKARTEAMVLMHSIINFNTPRNGESQIAATQDFLSTAFVLTSKNQFFSCKTIGKIFGTFLSREETRNIGLPAILKPVFLWTGKQVFSFIVFYNRENCPEKKEFIDLNNFQLKEKFYSLEKTQCSPFFCPYDGWILIRKSQLLAGRIGKSSLGSGIKNSILSLMLASHSFKDVSRSLLKISRFTSQWFSGFGFSIGISDISSDQSTMIKKKYILKQGFNLCQTVEKERSKKSQKPEMNKKKIESTLQKILGKLRENLSEFCLRAKNQIQSPISTMVLSGSKGTKLNLIQMVSCLGQQSVEGQRVKQGMIFRVFPHFKANIWGFEYSTNGFIKKSFFQGLNPLDFFFHAIAGREGLIDTAVKTAETGYLQRKLIKSLEDVISFFDGSVRTSNGRLLQFNFGDDGFDPNNSFWLRGTPYKKKKVISLFLKNEKNSLTREETDSFSRGHLFLDFGIISFTWKTFGSFKFFGNGVSLENFLDFSFIENYIRMVFARFNLSKVEAGDSVGAVAAQSIGEPGTQMTLQTFHSAGLANFNLNLGIPRVNEILNASKEINFPLVKVRFVNIGRKKDLLNTKLKLEKIFLGEISQKIEIVVEQSEVFIDIFLNPKSLQLLGIFNISKEICKKILKIGGFWKNFNFYTSKISGEIRIIPSEINDEPNFSSLKMIKLVNFCKFDLPKLLIHGFSEPIDLMNENSISGTTFFIEGTNLTEILYLETIDFSSIYCNHIFMVLNSLGIEAARKTIISEIKTSFDLHGISTDSRHLSLLADSMTHQGIILGINRHGLGKLKNNTLILASFEKTLDHLFTSAFRTSRDEILGVSENIILGKNLPVGTGTIVLKHLK